MAKSFSSIEWETINQFLDADQRSALYGMPQRVDGSLIFASWNIRKFGKLRDEKGALQKSSGAMNMIVRFCSQCDLIAIQELQEDVGSLLYLVEQLNDAGHNFDVIYSDVTGLVPGYAGMAERFAYIYNRNVVRLGKVASDLSLDRTAVLENISNAYQQAFEAELPKEDDPGFLEKAVKWITDIPRLTSVKFKKFVQFIRSPHLVEFVIEGPNGQYRVHCINAHLVSGKNKTERSNEFFALLEWLLLQSPKTVARDGNVVMVLADLNLDFQSNVDKRRKGIAEYVTNLNSTKNLTAKVNFPFLDGEYYTNARGDQTFDHIYYIADDTRWPRGRHNALAGTLGPAEFDYGMFDFTKLFVDAGPGRLPDGSPDFDRFSHDLTDHMPIWLRMPMPSTGQHRFLEE